jgi:hypothetical protein
MPKSEKNISKKSAGNVKCAAGKQPTSTTKVSEEKTFVPRILSWLCAANVTKISTTTQRGRKKKAI